MPDRPPRRLFLQGACLTSLAAWTGGCGGAGAELVTTPSGSGGSAPVGRGRYKESPMLAARVAAGKLPPVEQRLPQNPYVRQVAQIGKYGGTLYDHTESPGGRFHLDGCLIGGVQETDNDGAIIRPHLCDHVEVNKDASAFTFHIRDGLKWSDGVELTADDVIWWWQHEQRNKFIYPEGPRTFKVGKDYANFTKIDLQTFRVEFPVPFRPCLNLSAAEFMGFGSYFGQPSHWMKQFHIDFNPHADELARQRGFGAWYQLYVMNREYMHPHVNKPHVSPWVRVVSTTTHDIYERNPYYAEVDQEGNQLPYIDRIYVHVVEDMKLRAARKAAGANSESTCDVSQLAVYLHNKDRGDYHINHWHLGNASECMFAFNLNHKDPVKRRIYNDLRFRQALSCAIDRHRINETLFFGQAKEWQATLNPKVSYFDPSWVEHFAKYEPDRANALLDEAGLKWDSQHRYRLTPEGQRFLSVVIFNRQDYPVELLEFVRQDWARVGIEVNMKETDFRFREWTCRAGNQDCTCWNADLVEEIAAYLPWRTKWNPQEVLFYALDWWLWYYNNGASGTEPPEEWKDQFNRMADWYRAKDEEEYRRLGRAVWDFFTRQLVFIGTVGYAPQPVAIKNGLKNVRDNITMAYGTGWARSYGVQTYFWDGPEERG